MLESLFLLLPIAAFSGWFIGKRTRKTNVVNKPDGLTHDYYVGLNFLLNEQPNKAVDAFIKMLDVSPDSFDTTIALGNFFRKRGEVDRAIRIHQGLNDKPNLSQNQRYQSMLALAEDYMRAGVYDRAELSLLKLHELMPEKSLTTFKHLKDIYEREKEWEKAIDVSLRLQSVSRQSMGKDIAQYHCELAEIAWSKGQMRTAFKLLKQGLQYDSNCARISFLQGDFKIRVGKFRDALNAYKRIEHQDSQLLPEALLNIIDCYERIGEHEALAAYLDYLMHHHPTIRIALANAQKVKAQFGKEIASQFLEQFVHKQPSIRALKLLIEFQLAHVVGQARNELMVLNSLIDKILENKPIYRCGRCGFSTRSLQWQCPSCRQWTTIKPIQGMDGE